MFENTIELIYLILVLALFYYFLVLPERKRKARKENKELIDVPIKNKMQELDFYGVNKLQANPDKFLLSVEEKKQRMERGEEIAVDAMEAFTLIRNSKHHNLIVGEDGKINFRKIKTAEEMEAIANKIINYDKDGKKINEFVAPGYVQRIEDLKCGGVRWVFTQAHAEHCGIASTCYDKNNRTMPDPDAPKDKDSKPKNKKESLAIKAANEAKNESRKTNELLKDIALKRDLENNKRQVVESSIDGTDEIAQSITRLDFEKIMELKKENENLESLKADAEETFSEELQAPDFFDVLDIEKDEEKINSAEEMEVYLPQEVETEDDDLVENIEQTNYEEKIDYENIEMLSSYFLHHKFLFNSLIIKIFSKNPDGKIFLDFTSSFAYVEKNYFIEALKSFLTIDTQLKFDQDFLVKDTVAIFDGNIINDLIRKIDSTKVFEGLSSQRNGYLYLWNLLLESEDVAGVCFCGWFLKINFHKVDNIRDFLDRYARGADVKIIADKPHEVKRKEKTIKNLRMFN